jgi:exosortase
MPEQRSAGGRYSLWRLAGFTVLLVAAFWSTLGQWYAVSRASEDASHLVLMPLVAAFLLHWRRASIFADARLDGRFLPLLLLLVVAALVAARLPLESWAASDRVSLRVALLVFTWIAALGLLYGGGALRRALFPLGMLLLMVPIPTWLLQHIIFFLQWGSAEGTALLFSLTSTPVYREGFTFLLPGVAIEVAEECSGIRSSMALLITGLLAGHLYLRSNMNKLWLALAVVPLAIAKNALRIVTLTYLAVHVDPGFLSGDLHNRGGTVFFVLTLFLLGVVLFALRWREGRAAARSVSPAPPAAGARGS